MIPEGLDLRVGNQDMNERGAQEVWDKTEPPPAGNMTEQGPQRQQRLSAGGGTLGVHA